MNQEPRQSKIELPKEKGQYKVVQLYVDGQPRLATGSSESSHNYILQEFLKKSDIPFDIIPLTAFDKGPAPSGDRYQLAGAGLLIRKKERLCFNGKSVFYKVGINKEHLEDCKPLIDEDITIIVFDD